MNDTALSTFLSQLPAQFNGGSMQGARPQIALDGVVLVWPEGFPMKQVKGARRGHASSFLPRHCHRPATIAPPDRHRYCTVNSALSVPFWDIRPPFSDLIIVSAAREPQGTLTEATP